MHSTHLRAKMATTRCGMRRILKRPPSPVQYLKWAVTTGVYLDRDAPTPISRVYDSSGARVQVQPYPKEYEILSMNPPIPDPPKLTVKMQRQLDKDKASSSQSPLKPFVQSFMRRYDARMRSSVNITESQRQEYLKNQSMGMSRPASMALDSAMGRKASVLNEAYEFALRQYEVVEKSGGTMSEEASIKAVEEILLQEERKERWNVRQKTQEVGAWRQRFQNDNNRTTQEHHDETASSSTTPNTTAAAAAMKNNPTDTVTISSSMSSKSQLSSSTIPSILHSKPRTIRALSIWGQRLKAVPYDQWTLGAATALDHWIAVDVLGMTEESWITLLNGEIETDQEEICGTVQVGNRARAHDIITTRGYLFPETIIASLNNEEESDISRHMDHELTKEDEETNRSIDALLASLGGFDDDDKTLQKGDSFEADEKSKDEQLVQLVDQLQEWRMKNLEIPYREWDIETRKSFNIWLSSYIDIVRTDTDPDEVDLDATRDALLAEPPQNRKDTIPFWSSIQDETEAEILLHNLLKKGLPEVDDKAPLLEKKTRETLEVFLRLPYRVQLERLINLGSLRPLMDEYSTDSDRNEFIAKYGEMLLEGLEIEHLVEDPDGLITPDEVGMDSLLRNQQLNKDTRFSIQMIPYGTDEYGTSRSERARALFRAWNIHRTGRAQYEEYLFKKGKIGLQK